MGSAQRSGTRETILIDPVNFGSAAVNKQGYPQRPEGNLQMDYR